MIVSVGILMERNVSIHADLCHLYDLQQISANGYGKKHGMFAVRDSAQGLTVYMIYTLIIVVIMLALIGNS